MLRCKDLLPCDSGSLLRGELPRCILSLLDMIVQFELHKITAAHLGLRKMYDKYKEYPPESFDEDFIEIVINALKGAENLLKNIDIGNLGLYFQLLEEDIKKNSKPNIILERLHNLVTVFDYVLLNNYCFVLPPQDIKYFEEDAIPKQIRENLPDCIFDLEEANKCFAFGRTTACVYHSIRSLEFILPLIAKKLSGLGSSYDPKKALNDNWGTIIDKIDKELKVLQQSTPRSKQRNTKIRKLSEINAHMRSVKNAWRDPTMHAHGQFAEQIASDILNHTIGFIRYVLETYPAKKKII